ncbi:putative maleylacetoacetate isomerase 1 [Papilio xuthus]|uniref:maleylacetoacetate isomerase n=1 Tax=Papilio xuthus TaxID=66420 RepID=A0A194PWN1_PAPXU|nr:putative maleylacetoacetate isomerase 1 [Papilio xuthus]
MGRSMLPILILTTVALSSSDVLPILFNKDYIQPYNNKQDDNTFSDRYVTTNDIFHSKRTSQDYLAPIKEINTMYPDTSNQDVKDINDNTNKEQNYDDEGFRKEQWHNYPRQLDRLHTRYKEIGVDNLKSEKDDAESMNNFDDLTTDEIIFDNGDGNRNIYDTIIAATNPFLILKVQLSYLRDDKNDKNEDFNDPPLISENNEEKNERNYNKALSILSDRDTNVVKVKREKPIKNHDNEISDEELFETESVKTTFLKITMVPERAILYAYWLSSCSWRVRAALYIKRIPYDEKSVDIVREQSHLTDQYRAINPSQKVPALVIDGAIIVESMAILQYLEDTRPDPALTPKTPLLRARMTEICETIVSGIQPLQNIGLRSHFESKEKFQSFTKYWTERGLRTIEDQLQTTAGKYCVKDQLTMADLCLVPQVYNGVNRHALDLNKYPILHKIYKTLLEEDVFKKTHPEIVKSEKLIRL